MLIKEASKRLRTHIAESIQVKQRVLDTAEPEILLAAEAMTRALSSGRKIMLCGNGGSAADCQHIAAEFVSVLNQSFLRPGLPALALTTGTSILTASANDFGFDGVFARQVQALGAEGDVLIGISTSGNSRNVVNAFNTARGRGITTVAFTGASGGKLSQIADITIAVPSPVTQYVQEAHITVGHILCDLTEQSLTYDAEPACEEVV